MAKWIRWWGLGAFVVVAAILVGVWVFLVDGWVKILIEDGGTDAVGAKVELDAADLSLFPAGLTLTRLQVTDPRCANDQCGRNGQGDHGIGWTESLTPKDHY